MKNKNNKNTENTELNNSALDEEFEIVGDNTVNNEEEINSKDSSKSKTSKSEVQLLREEVNRLQESEKEWKNKYYEEHADIQNLRKQIEKDNAEFRKYMYCSAVEQLIPTLDALELTLKMAPSDEAAKKYVTGTQMIFKMFLKNLEDLGVSTSVPDIGTDVDYSKMQALDTIEADTENKVYQVLNRGYYFNDRIIRAAGVVVTKLKKENETETSEED